MAAVSMEQVWVCGEVKEYHGALHRSLTKKNGETIDILPIKASPSQTLKKKTFLSSTAHVSVVVWAWGQCLRYSPSDVTRQGWYWQSIYNSSYVSWRKQKQTLRSSQDSNLGLLNSGQMLLPTEPLELWYRSRGWMVYIHRHSSTHGLDLSFKTSCSDRLLVVLGA